MDFSNHTELLHQHFNVHSSPLLQVSDRDKDQSPNFPCIRNAGTLTQGMVYVCVTKACSKDQS